MLGIRTSASSWRAPASRCRRPRVRLRARPSEPDLGGVVPREPDSVRVEVMPPRRRSPGDDARELPWSATRSNDERDPRRRHRVHLVRHRRSRRARHPAAARRRIGVEKERRRASTAPSEKSCARRSDPIRVPLLEPAHAGEPPVVVVRLAPEVLEHFRMRQDQEPLRASPSTTPSATSSGSIMPSTRAAPPPSGCPRSSRCAPLAGTARTP